MSDSIIRTSLYTVLALIAFAANSVLCRLALVDENIDPYSFTFVRLLAGAVVLVVIVALRSNSANLDLKPNYFASITLFVYALAFSVAYTSLDTATGAVILFGSTQIALLFLSILNKERILRIEWLGLLIALGGFIYLLLPDMHRPPIAGFILMAVAGFAWGFYTYAGRLSTAVLIDTSKNFIGTIPLILVLFIFVGDQAHMNAYGIVLAILSGSIASGIGYVIWYAALRKLSSIQAATVPTLVPVIAAFGGVLLISEVITTHLLLSSGIIFSGILILIIGRYYMGRAIVA